MSGVQHLQVVTLLYFGLVRGLYSMCAAYSHVHRDVDPTRQKLHLLLESPWGTSSVELTVWMLTPGGFSSSAAHSVTGRTDNQYGWLCVKLPEVCFGLCRPWYKSPFLFPPLSYLKSSCWQEGQGPESYQNLDRISVGLGLFLQGKTFKGCTLCSNAIREALSVVPRRMEVVCVFPQSLQISQSAGVKWRLWPWSLAWSVWLKIFLLLLLWWSCPSAWRPFRTQRLIRMR